MAGESLAPLPIARRLFSFQGALDRQIRRSVAKQVFDRAAENIGYALDALNRPAANAPAFPVLEVAQADVRPLGQLTLSETRFLPALFQHVFHSFIHNHPQYIVVTITCFVL